mmetsp:Transcript_112406/g.223338  ORF Transcript_112406/g.223338 Transcript_112406/m.223338 type:complete len:95 (-) Transcript_112406:119-403(-)|eukprot:CAMPEP_0172844576 /NCGR_PEP_ID=MMETSP1075-20121228/32321_1 /TAXON_ID=2916 /ORGANISM="Ceratium fusus, Strain PA161109" /LENGTH=94 /DNA_ID=CAMNT_0013689039 /DNA_START=68 /DNA_END=352 /DNA_ORIENTATION=-
MAARADVQRLRARMRLALEEACRDGSLAGFVSAAMTHRGAGPGAIFLDGETKDGRRLRGQRRAPQGRQREIDQKVQAEQAVWRAVAERRARGAR